MPDSDGRLYLFEALALREVYDQRIALLEKLLDPKAERRGSVKLNQEIQVANFWATLPFDGEEISLAQALELRFESAERFTPHDSRGTDSLFTPHRTAPHLL